MPFAVSFCTRGLRRKHAALHCLRRCASEPEERPDWHLQALLLEPVPLALMVLGLFLVTSLGTGSAIKTVWRWRWAYSVWRTATFTRTDRKAQILKTKIKNIWPSRSELKDSAGAGGRGSVLGFFIRILPVGVGSSSCRHPRRWKNVGPRTQAGSARMPSKESQEQKRRTTHPKHPRSSRC